MVDRIGSGASLAREAILAAMKSQAARSSELRNAAADMAGRGAAGVAPGEATQEGGFPAELRDELAAIEGEIKAVDDLPRAIVEGRVQDVYEVAAQIKKAEFSFRFAMEIRNKLVDAYREVMRMNV